MDSTTMNREVEIDEVIEIVQCFTDEMIKSIKRFRSALKAGYGRDIEFWHGRFRGLADVLQKLSGIESNWRVSMDSEWSLLRKWPDGVLDDIKITD